MKFISIALFIGLSILFACAFQEQVPESSQIVNGTLGEKLNEKLTPFVEKILADHDCKSSVAIGITKGDEIIYAKAFGYANLAKKEPATLNTKYHMSSISKTFVASAIVKLQEQGKLNIDDRIIDHLPYFKLKSPEYKDITIKQLLTHSSGLPQHLGLDEWKKPSYDEEALERYVKKASDYELEFDPGAQFSYSDVGFNTLGDIISKASGMTFENYVEEHILKPSGMEGATFLKPEYLPEHWAAPYIIGTTTQEWKYYPYNRMYAPSNALSASVLDMCNWGMINLNHGTLKNLKVLDSASYDLLFNPWFDTPWNEKIGFSWFLQHYEGMKTILHTGADIGFESQLIMYPEEDISIAVMANRAYSRTARIANASMEIIKDLEVKSYNVSARFPFAKSYEENGLEAAKIEWKKLFKDTTDIYYANEWEMNIIGHGLIFTGEYEKALEIFNFNIECFPKSGNVYDSYGDALLAKGDTLMAITYFRKAMEVDSTFTEPISKLENLGQ
ncbi:serine hydrolase [Portibacter lacus]|uniref:Beta-lactamase-related domain-containing protein n=1 Tax=Portibacter lacus TaxID=1099794 RepID=A0AA37SMV0_9BACT|nr:serine hydrolase [Portibacter lacus]GLR15756.1 hypothetical protein GCM10007940_03710 [Portibacter lacus]